MKNSVLSVDIKKNLGGFVLQAKFETETEMLSVLGASGAGKSLLLKCIAGIEKPDYGRIVLGGKVLFDSEKRINLPPQKRKIGYLFQDYALFPNMTVYKNISCTAKNPSLVKKYISEFSLEGKENCYPSRLSGGEQQRVALARLLCAEPEVLLFDEPFSALDNHRKTSLERLLLSVIEEKKCPSILVTHDRNEAFRLSKNISVMENGTLSAPKEKHDFFENPETLAAVRLTGCKNTTRLSFNPDGTASAIDWGITLLPENQSFSSSKVKFAAFRAHYFLQVQDADGKNTFTCDIKRVVEDAFSYIIYFVQKNTTGEAEATEESLLCWEVPKENWPEIEKSVRENRLFARLDMTKLILLEK